MGTLLDAATLIAALGCGTIGGVFFAFSTFVMRALARLPTAQGVAAMQAINIAVIGPAFMTVFLGTAVCCLVLTVAAPFAWHEGGAAPRLAGSLLYLVGSLGVTMLCNVPRNDALAPIAPESETAAAAWARYVAGWTRWNHVRTAASLAAASLLTVASWR